MANKNYWEKPEEVAKQIGEEARKGLQLINKIQKPIITIFGSAQIKEKDKYYKHCEKTAFELGKKGYAILTGGGPGIMKAANTGAKKAGTISIGIRSLLIENQREGIEDDLYTEKIDLEFMFLRRFSLYAKSKAWLFYPGGIGTLDELSECLLLKYTGIRDQKPIICVGRKYWKGLFDWIEKKAYKNGFLMNGKEDLKLAHLVDTIEEVLEIIEGKK